MSSLRCTYSLGGDYHYFKGGEALNVHSLYVHDDTHHNQVQGFVVIFYKYWYQSYAEMSMEFVSNFKIKCILKNIEGHRSE